MLRCNRERGKVSYKINAKRQYDASNASINNGNFRLVEQRRKTWKYKTKTFSGKALDHLIKKVTMSMQKPPKYK
jgi:hypothetical protein